MVSMSEYYKGKRSRNLFDPEKNGPQGEPFKLSRSKLELFIKCPRCFYLDRRLGVSQPPGFPFNLNSAVDHLLKKEFDLHRVAKTTHPLMKEYGIDAVPMQHEHIDQWRANFVGVQYHHRPTNLIITGAVDDLWVNPAGEVMVVDYKATSKDEAVNLDADWQRGYKNQMEIYQWLLRQNGFTVSNVGYFVYANGQKDRQAFDGKLEFEVTIIPYQGDGGWVEGVIRSAHACLIGSDLPDYATNCDYCIYRQAAEAVEGNHHKAKISEKSKIAKSQETLF